MPVLPYSLSLSTPQQDADGLQIVVTPDYFRATIVVDITASIHQNTLVRLMTTRKKIIDMYSWYLMQGRNLSCVRQIDQLPHDEYILQLMRIGGEIIFSSVLVKAPAAIAMKGRIVVHYRQTSRDLYQAL